MISTIDIVVCILYITIIVTLGIAVGLSGKRKSRTTASNEYFLAGKTLKWPMIGLALFATNISCLHLVSLAQSGFDTGLLNGNFEWMAAFTLILLALFFAPLYIRSGVTTLPDFLERRYNRACRDWLAVISVFSAIIIHIAFSLLAGGIVLQTLLGVNMYISVSVIATVTALYTILGGLRAVVVTESIQTIVLVLGAIMITVAAWLKMGGWEPLVHVLQSTNQLSRLSMLHKTSDPGGMPWYAVFLGYPVIGIWYWCADQTIVQRVLGAKDENHARVGPLFCGFIKILPVFIFVLPGLFAWALAQKGLLNISQLSSVSNTGKQVVSSKAIYTLMITQLLPAGLSGIVIAALLSGMMSQISGALNSISTLISFDLYKRYRPQATERQLISAGQLSAGIALILSVFLLPVLNAYESIFTGINDVIAHIAPPITCVFLLGIFWKRASAKAANITLRAGSLTGVVVYAVNKLYPLSVIGKTSFMMMSFYLLCLCVFIQATFSYVYPIRQPIQSSPLIWKSPLEAFRDPGWKGLKNYKTLSAILMAIMVLLYWRFH
ncbi:MAG: sodium:solute symporter [Chitinophagales bacterium]